MTCAPVMRLAMNFDSASEISEPPMPNTAAKISSEGKSRLTPCSSSRLVTPNS